MDLPDARARRAAPSGCISRAPLAEGEPRPPAGSGSTQDARIRRTQPAATRSSPSARRQAVSQFENPWPSGSQATIGVAVGCFAYQIPGGPVSKGRVVPGRTTANSCVRNPLRTGHPSWVRTIDLSEQRELTQPAPGNTGSISAFISLALCYHSQPSRPIPLVRPLRTHPPLATGGVASGPRLLHEKPEIGARLPLRAQPRDTSRKHQGPAPSLERGLR